MKIQGTYTAIISPFHNGQIDRKALERLLEHQIENRIDGIVPVGTTGESPTLSYEEHIELVRLTAEIVEKRIKIFAGTGSNSTAEAIHLTKEAEKIGVDGVLLVSPYYNRPSQEGLFRHFSAIAASTSLPILLYNIPSRCGVDIAVDTVKRLVEKNKNIVGIKEAGGSVDRVSQLVEALPGEFSILSGDDALTLPFLSVGAVGVVSVASNLFPRPVSALVRLYLEGKPFEARQLHQTLYPLFRDLMIETNPVPVKTALAMEGLTDLELRLPLAPLQPQNLEKLKTTLSRTKEKLAKVEHLWA
ncbi:4-hydroxy-tetrahydrodipicolinate synthase [Candidatus Methylacidiphilum fumarolicum]|uniref:4-hydroxy-tetrahydrodipicolinate synthase n=2 Tax=Candidatus Methylacidiphilum fumarolicum TaxID=591154 RepID=I0JZ23_METFB|nr:4-hydroxy-tetrahydrodipicolinate synthase [Candidatus Methylacidiphilum fumarolicum]6T3T_A Chain A, 4-hydroxy-tetrahydrodipicolinate synthase [Methylacidiphilum fumariolicum SolV]6T3T_B Chain B, 4-hydroxy-tetrahydrodipicolinate synthase [Methylacidiphilum fumariolicum SolV]6T3T_C Chain C, 4-hydroxy-tetrahydrodipicolinate synthase [Methylacidiphilum fumariolicum SolV]6T3T_D Chain D, 4-hydroxy-tetrahydrodipicolinate synthase [Methylacidiphilum fumariolicum SolV]MBW6414650.1 4-hydroxy-tetrahyd